MTLHMVGPRTWSLPVGINHYRKPDGPGKADPIWGTQFTTKFSKKPDEDAALVTPKGALNVIAQFLDRVAEIDYLSRTQHQELATTQQELKANGLDGFSLSSAPEEDMDAANIAASHLRITPLDPDPAFIAAMNRRIEWEKYIFGCGPIHRVRFTKMPSGELGIQYEGTEKDPARILEYKRHLKYATIERNGALPTVEALDESLAFCAYYEGKIVSALMTEDEYQDFLHSRMFGVEDPDPERRAFHAENPRPAQCVEDPDEPGAVITADRPGGKMNVGYAGPTGFLGLDDDAIFADDDDTSPE